MESVLKADIFFVITTIAVVVIAVGLTIVIVYAVRFFRDISYLSRRVREEGDHIIDDVSEYRMRIKRDGINPRNVFRFVRGLFTRKSKNSHGKKQHEENTKK